MRRVGLAIAIVAVIGVIYGRVATFQFINLDDPAYVTENPSVLGGVTPQGIAWAFTTVREANWHPLTWISLQIDAGIHGAAASGFHVTNVALHAISAALLFLLFSRMTGCDWRSALVAALFAFHPLHVESVAWVAERKDVLSAALGLAACVFWLGWVGRGSRAMYALATLAYAASLLAKPMLVSLPLLLLLLDFWPLDRRKPGRALILEKMPFFALAAASSVVTLAVQAHGGATRSLVQYPPAERVANAAVAYVAYLMKAVWPAGLAVYYPYPYLGIAPWKAVGAAVVLLTVTAAVVRARRRAPYLLTGWLWYVVGLLPVIGIVQVGSQAMADRYTYLPLIGPFAMLAFALPDPRRAGTVTGRAAATVIASVAVMALPVYAELARREAGYFQDSVTLFTRALEVTRDNAVAHNCLSRALFERGQIDLAVMHCAEAVRIAPGLADAQANLVRGLIAQGKTQEAADLTREGLRDRPSDSRTHVNAGLIARIEGRPEEAIASFERALSLNAEDQEAHLNLGALLAALGRRDEALAQFEEAIRLRPNDARARAAVARLRANP